jgi:hypothetical protein
VELELELKLGLGRGNLNMMRKYRGEILAEYPETDGCRD